jgi:hypothetical protein
LDLWSFLFASLLEREAGYYSSAEKWLICGNTSELGEAIGDPRKRCLFFLTGLFTTESDQLEMWFISWMSTLSYRVSGVFSMAPENLRD